MARVRRSAVMTNQSCLWLTQPKQPPCTHQSRITSSISLPFGTVTCSQLSATSGLQPTLREIPTDQQCKCQFLCFFAFRVIAAGYRDRRETHSTSSFPPFLGRTRFRSGSVEVMPAITLCQIRGVRRIRYSSPKARASLAPSLAPPRSRALTRH